eukprot:gene9922-7792_t
MVRCRLPSGFAEYLGELKDTEFLKDASSQASLKNRASTREGVAEGNDMGHTEEWAQFWMSGDCEQGAPFIAESAAEFGISAEEVATAYGRFFVEVDVRELDCDQLFGRCAPSLPGMMGKMTDTHLLFAQPGILTPEVWVEKAGQDSFEVHCHAPSPFYACWLKGVIEQAASTYFSNLGAEATILPKNIEAGPWHRALLVTTQDESRRHAFDGDVAGSVSMQSRRLDCDAAASVSMGRRHALDGDTTGSVGIQSLQSDGDAAGAVSMDSRHALDGDASGPVSMGKRHALDSGTAGSVSMQSRQSDGDVAGAVSTQSRRSTGDTAASVSMARRYALDGYTAGSVSMQCRQFDGDSAVLESKQIAYGLEASEYSKLFPFHIVFNKDCQVVQAGKALLRLYPSLAESNIFAGNFFQIVQPAIVTWNFDQMLVHAGRNTAVTLATVDKLELKGTFIKSVVRLGGKEKTVVQFVGAPVLKQSQGIYLTDLTHHDFSAELVLVRQMFGSFQDTFEDEMDGLMAANDELVAKNAKLNELVLASARGGRPPPKSSMPLAGTPAALAIWMIDIIIQGGPETAPSLGPWSVSLYLLHFLPMLILLLRENFKKMRVKNIDVFFRNRAELVIEVPPPETQLKTMYTASR